MTTVSIHGTALHLDGRPTYAGRTYQGHPIEGLLFNVRAVQATFDDANPTTRRHWAYPDTGVWDAQRNVDLFCQALPSWRDHGVLAATVNWQGGGPLYVPAIYRAYDNNGFTPQGDLKPDYARRMAQVLARADELGMVVIMGLFYWVFLPALEGVEAVYRACDQALSFVEASGHRNVLIELANEVDVVVAHTDYALFGWERAHELLERLRTAHPGLLYSTSGGGIQPDGTCMPSDRFIAAADYVLFHGNGARPADLAQSIAALKARPAYRAHPKPLIINEDSPAVVNMEVCWPEGVSWGYYDQGWAGQADDPWVNYAAHPRWVDGPLETLSGFQTPPVCWQINTPLKRRFFQRVAEITGAQP
jgi:hypothetical protein